MAGRSVLKDRGRDSAYVVFRLELAKRAIGADVARQPPGAALLRPAQEPAEGSPLPPVAFGSSADGWIA